MIQHDMIPTDAVDKEIDAAHRISLLTQLPRGATQDVCPVCSRPVLIRHGHAMCVSGMCRGRVLEGCCGE